MSKRLVRLFVVVCLLVSAIAAQTPQALPKEADKFKDVEFLLGEWRPVSTGNATAGEASFQLELSGQVLVRHSFAEYGKGNRHDDVLYIYRESPSAPLRAIYFDNEGHVIHYNVTAAPNAVTFESDASQPGPRYRLSYQLAGKELKGNFELMMPGSKEYKPYLSWTSTKK